MKYQTMYLLVTMPDVDVLVPAGAGLLVCCLLESAHR
jgi:hypothetical protein